MVCTSQSAISLRVIAIDVILLVSGFALLLVEVVPRPALLRRQASHLLTYHGRAVQYLFLGLLSTDSQDSASLNKTYKLWSWISAATLASLAIVFFAFALFHQVASEGMPFPRSMKKRSSQRDHKLVQNETQGSDVEALEGWDAMTQKRTSSSLLLSTSGYYAMEGRPEKLSQPSWSPPVSTGSPKSVQSSLLSPPSGSPTLHSVPDPSSYRRSQSFARHSRKSSSRYHDRMERPTSKSSERPRPSVENNTLPAGRPSTAGSSKSSKRGLLGFRPASRDLSTDQLAPRLLQQPGSALVMRYETTQARLGNNSPLTIAAEESHFHRSLSVEPVEYLSHDNRHTSGQPRAATRKLKRVFVPSVGTFDVSSGSESDGKELETADEAEDDDDASVYSLDSAAAEPEESAEAAQLGRRLTRRETRKHKAKLDRGIQRVRSMRKEGENATSKV